LRTDASVDAAKICTEFGGGGHRCAAGCSISGDFNDAKRKIISAVAAFLGEKE
jgi:phosphoesterase RecJ-like protein